MTIGGDSDEQSAGKRTAESGGSSRTGGGRATAGGVAFQSFVGACVAAILLGERPASRLASGLPGMPRRVLFETPASVDDLTVETDLGSIYIQAKRTIALTRSHEGELASVASQFVRQFQEGIPTGDGRRAFDPARDRLVLAVSDQTSGSVANDLREALDRNRTGASTALPESLASALSVFSAHAEREWQANRGSLIADDERSSLLAACSVVIVSDAHRQLSEEALTDVTADPRDVVSFFDFLTGWATDAARQGTGGDSVAIRLAAGTRYRLVAPPSYRSDVSRLLAHSADVLQRLERYTTIKAPEGAVAIPRPVIDATLRAVPLGSLAITGEPGSGKSAVVHGVARVLAAEAPVVVFTVDASAVSLDALARDIGLRHSLLDTLAKIPGHGPAYLILDALDAVRGGAAEATYKRLVEQVSEMARWRVIASVRTFDLRLGRDWRRLFAGVPADQSFAEPTFVAVRHIHVQTLSDGEKADLTRMSPSLGAAIAAGGSRMGALAGNPFNLALLADLLSGGVAASSLSSVATRGQLLARYWDERITHLGTPAVVSMRSIVLLMIEARSIDIPETRVPVPVAATVDEIQRAGVLITETNRRVGFRHHILFDYAVARLVLLPDSEEAKAHLTRASGAGLLISPSLGYWLEALKREVSAPDFWSYVVVLVTNELIDPIIRIETARLAVESVEPSEDLSALLAVLVRNAPTRDRAFQYLAGALLTKGHLKQSIVIPPWSALLAGIRAPSAGQIGSIRALVGLMLEGIPDAQSMVNLGIASRTLFDVMSADDEQLQWLARHVVPFVARTFSTDSDASRLRLLQLFEPDRFKRFGHIEIPALAGEVLALATGDEELVITLFRCVFGGADFSRDKATPLSGSWILSMTSNAAQDFGMAGYSLSTAFPKLLVAFPRMALRALAAALAAERERGHRWQGQGDEGRQMVDILGEARPFEEDASHAWAWKIDEESAHDDYAKLYRAAMEWVGGTANAGTLLDAPNIILDETNIAIAWRVVLDLACRRPNELGVGIWPTPINHTLLMSADTGRSAVMAAAAIYPTLPVSERTRAETDLLGRSFEGSRRPEEARRQTLGRLFEAVGREHLATEAARTFLTLVTADGTIYTNEKPFAVRSRWGDDGDRHWLAREGVDTNQPEVAAFLSLTTAVRSALEERKKGRTEANATALWFATWALAEAWAARPLADQPLVEQEILDALAEGLGASLSQGLVPIDDRLAAIASLLRISEHSHPQPGEDTESNFEKFQSWGAPSPRVEAAQAIALCLNQPDLWPLIANRFESMMLGDPHPAVRFQLVYALGWIAGINREDMWRLAKLVAATERNPAILRLLIGNLPAGKSEDAAELEPIVHDLFERLPIKERGGVDPLIVLITYFAINSNRGDSAAKMKAWIVDFVEHEEALHGALVDLRDVFLLGYDKVDPEQESIRKRATDFIWSLIAALEPAVRSWPLRGGDPTPQEVVALKLFNEIADQFYFAVGHDQLVPILADLSSQRRLLNEYAPLISMLTTLGTPRSVHYLVQVLEHLSDADPERCFDLIAEAMLRTTGVARYEYESMGAALFVQIIGRYLADHRSLFDDAQRRTKLVDCIAVFVEAGWPEARRLFQNLPDLLR